MDLHSGDFVWDADRDRANARKHGINFATAARAFADPHRKIYADSKHSISEQRLFCVGMVNKKIVTVRFVMREEVVRIFGAGCWRKGARLYEKKD